MDLASYVIIVKKDGQYYIIPRFFSPKQLAKHKEKTDKVPYERWAKEGHVVLTTGDRINYQEIRDSLERDSRNFRIGECRYDDYGFEESSRLLAEEGYDMIAVTQDAPLMSPATNRLEKLILDGALVHNGNPCMTWCFGNTAVKIDNHERVRLDKVRSRGRIDGVVATVIGLTAFLDDDDDEGEYSGGLAF
jgi:phage terminase large subunit-like protein